MVEPPASITLLTASSADRVCALMSAPALAAGSAPEANRKFRLRTAGERFGLAVVPAGTTASLIGACASGFACAAAGALNAAIAVSVKSARAVGMRMGIGSLPEAMGPV